MSALQRKNGYIALASALIIAFLLALYTLNAGTTALLARFDTSDYGAHLQARYQALSCLYAGAYSLTIDPATYHIPSTGIDVFTNPTHVCHIVSITIIALDATVITTASVRTASVRIEGHINMLGVFGVPTITSWKEVNAI
jgi:hypothetical protein